MEPNRKSRLMGYEALAVLFDELRRDAKEIMTRAAEVRLQSQELRAEAQLRRREAGCWRWPESHSDSA
jgi:hypothetical protein